MQNEKEILYFFAQYDRVIQDCAKRDFIELIVKKKKNKNIEGYYLPHHSVHK